MDDKSKLILFCAFFLCMLANTAHGGKSRKLDEGGVENKCGSCPCDSPCNPPPSPPPPTPSPPPPSPSPPPPCPPPPVQPPPSNLCPPPPSPPPVAKCPPPPTGGGGGGGGGGGQYYPPSPPYIYINGPPGNLYPVDPYYSGSGRRFSVGCFLPLVIGIVLAMVDLSW